MKQPITSPKFLLCAAVLVVSGVGCGDSLEEVWGAYVGESTSTTRTNAGMRTTTLDEIISLTPKLDAADGELWVAISDRCVLSATLDDADALTVPEQPCELPGPNSSDTWLYKGSGSLSGGTLKLGLSGTFTRAYKDGSAPLEGSHESAFEGQRR